MDLDELLHQQGAQWRQAQPKPSAESFALDFDRRPSRPSRRPRPRGRVLLAVALVMAALLGVGAVIATRQSRQPSTLAVQGPTTTGSAPISTELQAALDVWTSFPVDEPTRPLILEGGSVSAPASGFTSNQTKDAFSSGAFIDPSTLPAGPPEAGGYPIIDATEGLVRLRADGDHQGTPTPLVITDVQLGTALFVTDRGRVQLPAWLVRFDGVADPAAVLAVAPSAIYTPPPEALRRPPTFSASSSAADDRTIVVTVAGGPAGDGPCSTQYTAEVAESTTAAAVQVHEVHPVTTTTTAGTSTTAEAFCTAMAYPRQVTVTLSQPLGRRVLVDASTSSAAVVTQAETDPAAPGPATSEPASSGCQQPADADVTNAVSYANDIAHEALAAHGLTFSSIGGTWAPEACAITITVYGVADADHAAVQDVLQHDLGSGFVVLATSATISPLDHHGH